jgi:hypothetical protein
MNDLWEDASALDVNVDDVLRVKKDAYKTDAGRLHNGRLVKVVDIKDGDIYVTTIDYKTPHIHSARHPAYKLEKKIAAI